jgi:hypothetical protein
VTWPDDLGVQAGQLAHRLARLRRVEVVGIYRDRRRLRIAVRVDHVDAVRDQCDAIALAPQPGRVARQVDDLEVGDAVALLDGAVDRHGPAVPEEAVRERMQHSYVHR